MIICDLSIFITHTTISPYRSTIKTTIDKFSAYGSVEPHCCSRPKTTCMACPFLSQGVNGRRNGLGVQGWTWEILRAFFRLSNILIEQFKAFFKLILRELLPQMDCLNGLLDRGQDILKLEVKLRPGSIFHSTRRQNQWKQDYGSHVCPKIGELAQIQSNAWPCE